MSIHIEDTAYRGIQRYYHKDWNIEAFNIPRNKIKNKEYKELDISGHSIYFLYGEDEQGNLKIYVGRSSDTEKNIPVFTRLNQHINKTTEPYHELWDTAIAIKFNKLTFDDMRHLENYFYKALLPTVKLNEVEPDTDAYKYDSIKHKVEYIKSYVNYILKEDVFSTEEKHEAKKDVPRLDYSDTELKNQGKRLIDKDFETVTEIQTPNEIVEKMLDLLPAEVWGPDTKFLDLACKSGEYLKAIFNRLLVSPLYKGTPYENKFKRTIYIVSNQLYGIALSDVSYNLTKENLGDIQYLIKMENIHTILRCFYILGRSNVNKKDLKEAKKVLDILNITEGNFEDYIKKEFGVGKDMKFDVVIGNPPYQEDTDGGGTKTRGLPLFDKFVLQAQQMADIVSMITPVRWYSQSDKSFELLRHSMLNGQLKSIVDYKDSSECFPTGPDGVSIAGGVSYWVWIKGREGNTTIKNNTDEWSTDLSNHKIFIRDKIGCQIASKLDFFKGTFDTVVCGTDAFGVKRKPLGIQSPDAKHTVKLIHSTKFAKKYNRGTAEYIDHSIIDKNKEYINTYKVYTEYMNGSSPTVLNNIDILKPNEICDLSFIVIAAVKDKTLAENIKSYMETKFVRFLIKITITNTTVTRDNYSLVPVQDFSHPWTDEMLYEKYGLSQEEIEYIENTIASYDKLKLTEQDGAAALVNKLINNN